jgi:2,3,4,5-tetrahydropyridine-2-carboxylate N-succinyltransferase
MKSLEQKIEALFSNTIQFSREEFLPLFNDFVAMLNSGQIRAAEPAGDSWKVNGWVKKGILLGFRYGKLTDFSETKFFFQYYDKDTYPLHPMQLTDNVRIVPGGTSIRTGSYVAPGVVIMPPAYINVGAFVDQNTMIDSHALVGSCAQIGQRVHLSAAAQIGGVLEPIGALPVIIEDDVMVGGNCGVYEGTIIKKGAVLGAGTILTASIPVYDIINRQILRGGKNKPLVIPNNAVVVPGSRSIGGSSFVREHGLSLSCALIIKYRDDRTDAATALEEALR